VEDKRNAYKVLVVKAGRVKNSEQTPGVYGVIIILETNLKTKSGKM